jgi:hypothetical protein
LVFLAGDLKLIRQAALRLAAGYSIKLPEKK